MVAKGFGSRDSDKVGKEKSDKPMLKASTKLPTTGMVGGVANDHPTNRNEKKDGKRGASRGR